MPANESAPGSVLGSPVMDEASTTTTDPPAPPLPPPRRAVSMKPAAIVLGLATLVLIVFAGGAALFKPAPVKTPSKHSTSVAGTSLRATGALDALRPIVSPGEPPNNVLNAVVVPTGARRLSHINYGGEANQYDQAVVFSVGGVQAAVIDFYRVEMKKAGGQ